jgi:Putative Actinobacterial Holin-X, holin superfamily III
MAEHNGRQDARDRPVGELMKDLSDQTTTLVRKEIELAKAELAIKGKKAGLGAGMFGGGRGCSASSRSPA